MKRRDHYGYKPTRIGVALDSLAIYVNKDNTLASLSLPQVDAIFSKSRKSGYPTDITEWKHLTKDASLATLPISIYGRNCASGTYAYFKEHTLFKGDYKNMVKEQLGPLPWSPGSPRIGPASTTPGSATAPPG